MQIEESGDQILGFDDVSVWSNDAGYVVVSQYHMQQQEEGRIVLPAAAVESLVKLLRKHKRLVEQAKQSAVP